MGARYLTLPRAARYLHVDVDRMDRLVDQGIIPAVEIRNVRMVNRTDLDFWHAAQKPPKVVQQEPRQPGETAGRGKAYSEDEEEYLLTHLDRPASEIGKHLGRVKDGVREQIRLFKTGKKEPRTAVGRDALAKHLVLADAEAVPVPTAIPPGARRYVRGTIEARLCPICGGDWFGPDPAVLQTGGKGWGCCNCGAVVPESLMKWKVVESNSQWTGGP